MPYNPKYYLAALEPGRSPRVRRMAAELRRRLPRTPCWEDRCVSHRTLVQELPDLTGLSRLSVQKLLAAYRALGWLALVGQKVGYRHDTRAYAILRGSPLDQPS